MSIGKTHIDDMQNRARAEPYLRGFGLVQLAVVALVALGHISTLPLGPGNPEALHHFGYDPSWFGVNVLFILSGFMALRSLERSPGGLSMILSRIRRVFPFLAVYALLIVLVVYPVLGQAASSPGELFRHLGLYAIDVLVCIDPGRKLPGLLDNANYQCVIQGAIWTFRWGIVAFVAATVLSKLGVLQDRWKVLGLAIIAVSGYVTLYSVQVWGDLALPENLQPAARLGAMFCIGMAVFAYRSEIFRAQYLPPLLLLATAVQYYFLPWTPMIEIFASVFWALAAFTLMRIPALERCNIVKLQGLAIALYIFHWPIAQLILLSFPGLGSWALIVIALPAAMAFSAALSFIMYKVKRRGTAFAVSLQSENSA